MSRRTAYRWLARLIRLGLGALLLWTAIGKIVAPAEFLSSIYNYELLKEPLANVLAVVLPWVEVLAGVCLLGGVCAPGALIVCMGLFAAFAFAHGSVLYRGMSIDCGCGLIPGDDHVSYWTLARSLFLLACAAFAYRCTRSADRTLTASAPAEAPQAV